MLPTIKDKIISMPSLTINPALINIPAKAGIMHKKGIGVADTMANKNKIILYIRNSFGDTTKSKRFFVSFSINVKYRRDERSIFLIIFLFMRHFDIHLGINTLFLKKQI